MKLRNSIIAMQMIIVLLVSCSPGVTEKAPALVQDTKQTFGRVMELVDFDAYRVLYHVSNTGSDENGNGSETSPFATLQKAMDAVSDASESNPAAVLVAAGAYGEGPIQMQNYIDLFGGFDPGSWERDFEKYKTILSGGGRDRVLIADDHSRLDGFYIMNGRIRGNGGAIYCDGTSPEISNNYFHRNVTMGPIPWDPEYIHEKAHDGGAIYAANGASPTIRNNIFIGNETENGRGAAVALHNRCGGIIQNNVFLHNSAGLKDSHRSSDGGAVSVFDWCDPEIRDNLFIGNHALTKNDGGGLFVALWSSARIMGNYFFNNEAMDDAGALFIGGQEHRYDSPLDPLPPAEDFYIVVRGNIFMGNRNPSLNSGATRITMESRGEFSNNLAAFNNGVYIQRSDLAIDNNTIVDNLLLKETKGGLQPCRIRNTVVMGKIVIETAVDISHCLLMEDEADNPSYEVAFREDGIKLQAIGVMTGEDRMETRLIIQGDYEGNILKNRVVRAGDRFTLVRENRGNRIILWDDLSSEKEFMIMPSYTPEDVSAVIDKGIPVNLDCDLYGNSRPRGAAFDIGAVEIQ
jgi:hypothetical protein